MARVGIYFPDGKDKESLKTFEEVAKRLDTTSYKGATASAFLQWLGEQSVDELVEALKPLRAKSLRDEADRLEK